MAVTSASQPGPWAVTEEVLIAASPETVLEFFVDPALMRTWMGGRAVLEPRPGGVFAVDNPGADPHAEAGEIPLHESES